MDKHWLMEMLGETQIAKVIETNQYTQKFNLALTEEDAKLLVQERKNSLETQQRVEFGEGILAKLIYEFCDSSYIYQDNYVDSIGRLQEIFYLYKNEALDEVSDDELIDYMKHVFEGECEGDFDYLEGTCLDQFAREVREGTRKFIGLYEEE